MHFKERSDADFSDCSRNFLFEDFRGGAEAHRRSGRKGKDEQGT
jgi:hypothetical protein